MSNLGVKISKRGYNVDNCADHELIFSSEAPLPKVLYEGTFTVTDTTASYTILTHNLGFIPLFLIFTNRHVDTTGNWAKTAGASSPETSSVSVSSSIVKYWADTGGSGNYGPITFRYVIFDRPLLTNASYTNISPLTSSVIGDGESFGISVSNDGKDISDADYRNRAVDSNTNSMIIHKTGYANGGGSSAATKATIPHGLGYEPMFFFFIEFPYDPLSGLPDQTGHFFLAPNYDSILVSANTSDVFLGAYPGIERYAYIIFKDPIL